MSNPIEKALKILANSCYYWHTSEELGGPYTAWRGEGEPDEIAEEALSALRSGKYCIEEVPEGMKEPTLVDGERLEEVYPIWASAISKRLEPDEYVLNFEQFVAYLRREVENNTRGQ